MVRRGTRSTPPQGFVSRRGSNLRRADVLSPYGNGCSLRARQDMQPPNSCCPFPSGVAHPLICFLGSVYAANRPWAQAYIEQLLCPQDWFSFWRLNCRLASYHALVTGCDGYRQEDKVGCVGCQRRIPGCPGEMQPSLTNRTLRHAT